MTMIMTTAIITFIIGIVFGGLFIRLLLKYRLDEASHQWRSDYEQNIAVLNERLETKNQGILVTTQEISALKSENTSFQTAITALKIERSSLETTLLKEQKAADEKLAILDKAKTNLSDAFKALSAEALKSNNQMFLEVAKSTFEKLRGEADSDLLKRQVAIDQLVKPVHEGLNKFDIKIQSLEKARIGAYEGLNQQVKSLIDSQQQLRSETSNLVNALRTPQARGRWGEIQLKRVVEMAGMLNHCDFKEQPVVSAEESRLRPDLIVNLPGGKTLVVDAKVPLSSYLESMESKDDLITQTKLKDHARRIREHITELSRKSYWEQFQPSPEFVVLFLPGESFFSAALQEDPSLIEQGVDQKVIIATPTTLIALLKAVAYGWKQENLAENAKKIGELGKELYKRIFDMSKHFRNLGSNLQKSVESYNKSIGTLESRVLVSARRFQELNIANPDEEIPPLSSIDIVTRHFQAPEMIDRNEKNKENTL